MDRKNIIEIHKQHIYNILKHKSGVADYRSDEGECCTMKQMPEAETKWGLFGLMLALPLLAVAQVFDTTPPTIAHQPVKLGREGKALPIIAFIGDNSGVKNVRIVIEHDGKSVESQMTQVEAAGSVPVVAQTRDEEVPLFATPSTSGKVLGKLGGSELLHVTLQRPPFYRVRSESGLVGYVEASRTDVVESGAEFRINLPARLTAGGSLAYQIFASDDFGNEAQTAMINVRLVSDEEVARMQQNLAARENRPTTAPAEDKSDGMSGETPTERRESGLKQPASSRSLFSRPGFWIATAAVGGGAWYLLSGGDEDGGAKKSDVGLVIGW